VGHLREHGFDVKVQNLADRRPLRARHGVPQGLESCHTGLVGGYVVEGHVPADAVKRLLRERPAVAGLAVPGMPIGSPGMEAPGVPPQRYKIFSFDRTGRTSVFETR
jgi:hypothetical protein